MLYVYYGGDISSARAKLRATIENMLMKNPDALSLRITEENFAEHSLAELVQAQALFKNEYIVFLDSVLSSEYDVLEFMDEIAESSNIFFILEEKIDAKILKKLENKAVKIQKFEVIKEVKEEVRGKSGSSFNAFTLADALGEANRKKLWILYCKAKFSGVSDEEIHGVFFWMAKSMLLAINAGNAEDVGMKPFVFSKAKRFASNRSKQELTNLVNILAVLPHESRRNSIPLSISLEKFILST